MSNATNLALLGLSGFGPSGNVLTSTGNTSAPTFSASGVGVREIRVVNRVLSRLGVNKSTGNVSVSALPDISEIPVPSWINGGHISDWSTLQYYLSAVAETNTSPAAAAYVELVGTGTWPGNILHNSAILAPNGKIYCAPYGAAPGATLCRIVDPENGSITTFGAGSFPAVASTFYGYANACLAPNGKIYLPAIWGSTLVKTIDPSNNTVANIHTQASGSSGFDNPILGPNGKIYCTPVSTAYGYTGRTFMMVIDPNTNTVSSVGPFPGSPSMNTGGGILHPNGKIYYTPNQQTYGLIFDPTTDTFTTYVPSAALGGKFNYNVGGNGQFSNAVLVPDGRIFFTPYNSSIVAIIDPSLSVTDNNFVRTFSYPFSSLVSNNTYWPFLGGALAPNGKIYLSPGYATLIGIIDPKTETLSTFLGGAPAGLFGTSGSHTQPIVTPNGKIFFVPTYANTAFFLNALNKNNWNINVCTNPMINNN